MRRLHRLFRHGLVFTLLILTLSSSAATAADLIVTTTADVVDANDSQTSLREALAAAQQLVGAQTITFDPTVFATAQTITLGSELAVNSNVTITGPGADKLTLSGNNVVRIFNIGGVTPAVAVNINGLTLANGRHRGADVVGFPNQAPSQPGMGGAILNQASGAVTITDCILQNSTAQGGNGAVTQSGNGSAGSGGGIAHLGTGTLRLVRCRLSGLNASGGNTSAGSAGSGQGGAVFATGPLEADACAFESCVAVGGSAPGDLGPAGHGMGGAIAVSNGASMILFNCTLASNTAQGGSTSGPGGSAFGGGLWMNSSAAGRIVQCTLAANQALGGVSSGSRPRPSGSGGAVYTTGTGTLQITQSTIATNSVSKGTGGVDAGVGSGGGVMRAGTGVVTLANTIVGRNTSSDNDPDVTGAFTSSGFNLIGIVGSSTGFTSSGDQVGTGGAPVNPLLGNVADNGGPTRTMGLQSGSPAINAGNNALAVDANSQALTTDQRGLSRIRGGTVDIGAFESGPGRLYVNQSVTGGDGSGDSWANAMPELRTATAISLTDPNVSEIWVARGTYKPAAANSGDRGAAFHLRSGLSVYGGFSGGEALLSQRDVNPDTNATVLSGDLDGNDAPNFVGNGENSFRVVTVVDSFPVLDGFTLQGARAEALPGGGIYCVGGAPTFRNLKLSGNYAVDGGGIYLNSSSPSVTNVTISGNHATRNGGGLVTHNSLPRLNNVIVSGNSAAVSGGGLYSTFDPRLTNVTFSGNSAPVGGAFYSYFGSPILSNCILWGNSGGEIFHNSGSSEVHNSIIQGGYDGSSDVDPLFITPITAPAPTTTGNLRLRAGSPAINAGNNSAVTATTDLDGAARIIGANVDLGAYELIAPPTLTNTQLTIFSGGSPSDLAALTGASPTGGVFSGTGVSVDSNGRYVFDSTAVALGTQVTVTYTVSGPSGTSNEATATVTVFEAPSLTVTSTSDTTSNTDGQTTLREAFDHAITLTGPQTITFSNSTANGAENFHDGTARTIALGTRLNLFQTGRNITIAGPGADRLKISGGGLRSVFSVNSDTELTLSDLTVADGFSIVSEFSTGGAILNSGTLTLLRCVVRDSGAFVGLSGTRGGGLFTSGNTTIIGSTFTGNSAGRPGISGFARGAAIYATSTARVKVINSTISGNTAMVDSGTAEGAGIYAEGSGEVIELINTTVTANSATVTGGAGATGGGVFGDVSAQNSIIAGNTSSGSSPNVAGNVVSGGHNLIYLPGSDTTFSGDTTGNLTDVDPALSPLAANSGSTPTHGLLTGSPAIDAGSNALALDASNQALTTDQRGQARTVKGNQASSAATVDIGAYELFAAPVFNNPALSVVSGGGVADLAAAGASPAGGTFSGTGVTGTTFDPTGLGLGSYTVTYTVSDGFGASNSANLTVTVAEVPSLTVTTTSDTSTNTDGLTSLREAIAYANSGNAGPDPEITFGNGAALGGTDFTDDVPDTIVLSGNHLHITASMTITGRGAEKTIVDGNGTSRIFLVDDGTATEKVVEITGLTVQHGNTGDRSGGILNTENLSVSESVLSGNLGELGGGCYNVGVFTMSNCRVSGNTAVIGGGIYNDGTFTLIESEIANNQTDAIGGIYNSGSFASKGNIVRNNRASSASAGGIANGGQFSSTADLITGNYGPDAGAALSGGGTFTATNVTITNNQSITCAVACGNATFNTTNVTIANNSGHPNGSGVLIASSQSNQAIWNARNTIIAGNAGADVGIGSTTTVNADHTIIGDLSYSGPGVINTAPVTVAELFVVDGDGKPLLADHGGPTPTIALAPGSPAIDAGDNALALDADDQPLTSDQRGQSRVRGGTVDIGAFESAPARLYIDQSVTGGDGSGDSWANAMPELRTATAMAQTDPNVSEIWVARGTYKPAASGGDLDATFQLRKGLAIYGGFSAGQTQISQRDANPVTNATVLSGDLDGNDSGTVDPSNITRKENSLHVLVGDGTDATAVIDGFTVSGGNATGATPFQSVGGGMRNDSGSPTLINVLFSSNSAKLGGGIGNRNGSNPTLVDVTFSGNGAGAGGGIYNETNCSPVLNKVAFVSNSVSDTGGAIYSIYDSSPILTNVTFIGNVAAFGGGMVNVGNSNPTLVNATFIGNAASFGGGIFNTQSSSPTLINVTISGNDSDSSGGIYCESGCNPTIRNSILWDNGGGQIGGLGTPTVIDTIVQGGYTKPNATNIINQDPLFVTPITAPAPTTTGNLRLRAGSPAINAGNNSAVTAPTDLDGAARIIGANVDLGAYELIAPPTLTNTQLTVINGGNLSDLATLTGASPDGGAFSGTGVSIGGNGNYIFDSTGLPLGTEVTVTYTVSGPGGTSNETTFAITVIETPSLTVTTTIDPSTNTDGLTSLREAIAHAKTLGGAQTIRFNGDPATLPKATGTGIVDFHDGAVHTLEAGSAVVINNQILTITGTSADRLILRNFGSPGFLLSITNGSTVELSGMTVTGAASSGISSQNSDLTLRGCVVSGNATDSDITNGGGIYNVGGDLTLVDSTVSDNAVQGFNRFGGGIYNHLGTATLRNCTVSGNSLNGIANNYGAGIYNEIGSTLILVNSTVSGNSSNNGTNVGAGIYSVGTMELTNCTVTNNSASGGADILSGVANVGTAHVRNSIISGNTASAIQDWSGPIATDLNNLIGEQPDLRLAPLGAYGGPTMTHALLPGSSAIDAGDNTLAVDENSAPLTSDQRGTGFARVAKGSRGSATATVDIGAFELFAAPEFTTDEIEIQIDGQPLDLTTATGVSPTGGVFSGPGVSSGFFDPRTQMVGSYEITYTYTGDFGIINTSSFIIDVIADGGSLFLQKAKAFPLTQVGRKSKVQRLSLSNRGDLPVSGIRLVLRGAGRKDFKITQPVLKTLAPLTTTTWRASFHPKKPGSRRATVMVLSNARSASGILKGKGTDDEFLLRDPDRVFPD